MRYGTVTVSVQTRPRFTMNVTSYQPVSGKVKVGVGELEVSALVPATPKSQK